MQFAERSFGTAVDPWLLLLCMSVESQRTTVSMLVSQSEPGSTRKDSRRQRVYHYHAN